MQNLIIGNKTAKIPIIQGGMGVGVSRSGLAGAVAAAGGVGVLALIFFRDKLTGSFRTDTGTHTTGCKCDGFCDR